MWLIVICALIIIALITVALVKMDDVPVERSEVYDEWMAERIKTIFQKLENQKKYLIHLDEKRLQSVITNEQYEEEFSRILANINEIMEEMDNLGMFEEN